MFGAIYVGLSGLNAYSRGLTQVSNNVANMNSNGFKETNVSFTDFAGVTSGGLSLSGSGGNVAGGVQNGTGLVDFAQGELRQTNRDLDLSIDGTGFLVLMKGDQLYYARTGSFEVDKNGFVVLAGTDYRLATLDGSGRAVSLSIDASRTNAPTPTTTIKFADNLSSTASTYGLSDVKVYDAAGAEHVWQVQFTKSTTGGANDWKVKVTDSKAAVIGEQTLTFNQGLVDPATQKLVFTDAAAKLSVTLDFSTNVTSFSSGEVSTLRTASVDGHKLGTVTGVTINAAGQLELAYSNQEKTQLGPVAIADFRDPQSLEKRSGGLYVDKGGSGREFLTSESQKTGRVVSKKLEASNVDLAKEFGDMIIIQRGYQASSQIISVANEMIQHLFNLRGQG